MKDFFFFPRTENYVDLDSKFEASIINSTVYLISMAMQLSTFAVNYKVSSHGLSFRIFANCHDSPLQGQGQGGSRGTPPSPLSIETFREDDRKLELFDGDATSTVKAN